jgi:peptidoglycan/xylan/chitin deacetylase (PgdA/CDA1 family)
MGLSRAAYRVLAGTGADRMFWRFDSHRLRILCYHGVCADRDAEAASTPDCFVTASAFAAQMQHLAAKARVLPLAEAASRLRDGSLPSRAVCVTFDDGFANNLHTAYPVLAKYKIPATMFLSSAYIESGDFHPFVKLKLLALHLRTEESRRVRDDYKSSPLDAVLKRAEPLWKVAKSRVTEQERETLRPLTPAELCSVDPELVEFGGHSHTHCILANESESRRRDEIVRSTELIATWTGRPVRLFAYPNGQASDFGAFDQQVLREAGIRVAVTGIAGANACGADPLALRRYPLGLYHDAAGFRAELSGLRSAILRMK